MDHCVVCDDEITKGDACDVCWDKPFCSPCLRDHKDFGDCGDNLEEGEKEGEDEEEEEGGDEPCPA